MLDEKLVERALRFKLVRNSLNLSQVDFGKELGISQNYISAIEKAKRNVTSKILSELEIKFNINPNWLLSKKGDMYISQVDKLEITDAELREIMKSYELLDDNKRNIIKSMIDELSRK